MSPELILLLQLLGPPIAAFMAVNKGVAVATEKAETAAKSAARAHVRLDEHMAAHK